MKGAGYRVGTFVEKPGGDRPGDEILSFVHAASDAPFYVEWMFDATSASGLIERGRAPSLPRNVPHEAETRARDQLSSFYAHAATRDRDFGALLAALDRPGLEENTIVVFTSDRGEQMGSHGLFGDDAPYEESVRIPLAIRYPAAISKGRESDVLVSQIDIMPTLLGICGIEVPETVQGRNLSRLMTEDRGERPDAIYAEGRRSQPEEWRMIVHGYDKLVMDTEGHPLHQFNLADDPQEMNDLMAVTSEQVKRDALAAMLQVELKRLNRIDSSGLRLR